MFTYEDWSNLSVDFPDVTRISNKEIFDIFFNEYIDRGYEFGVLPLHVHGYADVFDGVPFPTLVVHERVTLTLTACEMLEELYENFYEFCGYAASRVMGTSAPTKVTFTGTAYVVQSLGRLDEGFPDLESALTYCIETLL